MISLKTVATGSDGNCHILEIDDEILLIDLGIGVKNIKKACDFNVSKIKGAIVTHWHGDHAKSVDDLKCMGKQVFRPYARPDRAEKVKTSCGGFDVVALALTDKDCNRFVHTNTDNSECPNYAFYITHRKHPDFNLFYATDCQYIKWQIPSLKNVLLGVDYESSMLDTDNSNKFYHQVEGHLNIDTACEFIGANKISDNVIFTHLSLTNANADEFRAKAKEVTDANIEVAWKGKTINLERK